jgi:hypothetical protein
MPPEALGREERDKSSIKARLVCGRCPLRAGCFGFALEGHVAQEVFGGLSPRGRAQLQRRRPSEAA